MQFNRHAKQTKIPVDFTSSRHLFILSIFMAQNIEISPQNSSFRTISRNRSFCARRFPLPSRHPQAPLLNPANDLYT